MDLLYFSAAEVAGLVDPVPTMLDILRGFLGSPVILTSTTGGQHCPHSAHYKGLAVDCGLGHLPAGFERDRYCYMFVRAAMKAGFQRIEVCPLHVHLDHGQPPDYPSPILMMGVDA